MEPNEISKLIGQYVNVCDKRFSIWGILTSHGKRPNYGISVHNAKGETESSVVFTEDEVIALWTDNAGNINIGLS